jgi:hypothetical protein
MPEFNVSVRWSPEVQPYVSRLASGHIADLRRYCEEKGRKILRCRARDITVVTITARVAQAMLEERALHRFRRLGFHFQLDEAESQNESPARRAFVLNFATKPRFRPDDMPPRLRRKAGKALSARPARARARARPMETERIMRAVRNLWAHRALAAGRSRFAASFAFMAAAYGKQRSDSVQSVRVVADVVQTARSISALLTSLQKAASSMPVRARFARVSSMRLRGIERPLPWDTWLFGEPAAESERKAA